MKCPKCDAEQKGAVETCSVCGTYLLSKKTASDRILGLLVGLVLLAGIVAVTMLIEQTWSFWAALLILGGPMGKAFSVAFAAFPPSAAYVKRAREYAQSDPEQAIADITKAIELAPKRAGAYYSMRAQIYEQSGSRQQALQDLQDLQRIRELPRGERGGIQMTAVEKEIQRLGQEVPEKEMEKLREEAPEVAAAVEAAMVPYVGFMRRGVAYLIDGAILTPIVTMLYAALAPETAVYIWLIVACVYFLGFWVWRGQTPGKMAVGIRIVHGESSSVGFGRAIVRLLIYPLSIVLFPVTWIVIEADKQKRAPHDLVAGTRVIRTSAKQLEEMK